MRKLKSLLIISLTLLFVVTSCSEKDDTIIDKGTLISATFSPTTKMFTLKYSKGSDGTIDANIDNSVSPPTASATLEDGTIITIDDATLEGMASIESLSGYKYVNDWIFKEMNVYYLWNTKIPKNPDFTLRPEKFFNSLLYKYDKVTNPKGDRFSWIQENYSDLLGSLSGIQSDEIGFEYIFVRTAQNSNQYYALVTYPKLGTDAFAKGIKRGRFITQVDGKEITSSNYKSMFSGTGIKTLSMADYVLENDKYVLKNSGEVKISMVKNFAETPVYLDSVYSIADKKIGYMVYNFFATGKTNMSHEYDELLMHKLANIKAKGATEMVLDLRYNGGGSVSTAIALASALVKDRNTKNVLVTAEYNALVDSELKKEDGVNYNKDFFIDKIEGTNIVVPALNLPRLYVLVTGGSASASELIINGLKPYMEVILIGETTYGKNVGSISIYEEKDPKNKWGMQPIIVKYYNSNGESEFTAGFPPNFEVDEFETLRLVDFGNTEDPLLSVALNQITGGAQTRSMRINRQIATTSKMNEVDGTNSIMLDKSKFEMYDDVRGESIKKLMKK
ncbi:MAG: S41 family peptidase [Candidatus Saccharimonadaceae bacterium]